MARILTLGFPTALASMLVAGAITSLFVDELPYSHAGAIVFGAVGALIPLMALSRYKAAFISMEQDRKRWIALAVPAFVVMGAMVGGYSVHAIYQGVHRDDDFWGRAICQKMGLHSGARFEACHTQAVVCPQDSRQYCDGNALGRYRMHRSGAQIE